MPSPKTTEPRVVFGMECHRERNAANSYISVLLTGDWDLDMLEGLVEFVARQRRRLAREAIVTRGPLICDGWE